MTGERRASFRDHCLFATALATGLRESEILALNFGDVFSDKGRAKRVVRLRVFKGSEKEGASKRKDQEVRLPDGLRSKLERLRKNMDADGLSTGRTAPLFVSSRKKRLSSRMVRVAFKRWQAEAGFERSFTFHDLRHTAITTAYHRSGKDLRVAQRFARHADISTTQRYIHASDDALESLAGLMPC